MHWWNVALHYIAHVFSVAANLLISPLPCVSITQCRALMMDLASAAVTAALMDSFTFAVGSKCLLEIVSTCIYLISVLNEECHHPMEHSDEPPPKSAFCSCYSIKLPSGSHETATVNSIHANPLSMDANLISSSHAVVCISYLFALKGNLQPCHSSQCKRHADMQSKQMVTENFTEEQ